MGSIESVPAAFQLTVVDGAAVLSFRAPPRPSSAEPATQPEGQPEAHDGWGEIDALDLSGDAGDGATGARSPDGAPGASALAFQNRRLSILRATIGTNVARLSAALATCPLADFGIQELRLWSGPDGLRLVGRATVEEREAPFTIRIAVDPRADGRRRLRVLLADVRLFAHLPLPAPLVGAAIARAIGAAAAAAGTAVRAFGPMLDIDPLELALVPALVGSGWRLPNLKRGWLESVELPDGDLRLHFGSQGYPTDRLATLDQASSFPVLAHLEGERLPDWLTAAEERLFAGDLEAAEAGYRRALSEAPSDLATQARLLALWAAAEAPDASALAAAIVETWPDFLPGMLYTASLAFERGDAAAAAAMFGRAATLADQRGETVDAELARAAAARAQHQITDESSAAEPAAAESATVEPAAPEPAALEPAALELAATEPAAAESATVEPAAPEPAALEPAALEEPTLAALTDQAVARGDLAEADQLFSQRLALAENETELATLTTDRARVRLMGPGGAAAALETLREIRRAATPEEGLVLRADLAERLGDAEDARETLGELASRADAAGDPARARELSEHRDALGQSPDAAARDSDAPDVIEPAGSGEPGDITTRTVAVYSEDQAPESRADALATLLDGFLGLPPELQHAAYASFARVAESHGDLEHAAQAYEHAARIDGQPMRRAGDLLALAGVLLARGNTGDGIAQLEEALALAPEHAGVLALLANQVFVAEDWDRARDLYARIDRAPDSSAVIARETLVLRRALLARRAGDVDEAATCYREVAGSNPRHVEARMALAEIALVRGEPGVAAECLEEVLRLLPLDALEPLLDVRQRLAEIHVQLGDWTTARYYTELILAQDPGRLSALERLVDAGLHLDLPQLAVDACDRIARLQREPAQRARALYRQGEILREALGDEERAFDIYLRSSDWDPGFAPTALRLVEGYWRRGHFADAAGIGDDLRRAGPLPPMETSVRLHLALATALAHGDAGAAFTVADLSTTAWDAESGAAALKEVAAHLSAKAPRATEPAIEVLLIWQAQEGTSGAGTGGHPGPDPLEDVLRLLRAQVSADPGALAATRALAILTDRRGDATAARPLFATIAFVDDSDGAAAGAVARFDELGPAPVASAAALALGGPTDHPQAAGRMAPLRRSLAALAHGLAGFGSLGTPSLKAPTTERGLGAERRDALYGLAQTLRAPPLALLTDDAITAGQHPAVVAIATRPATIQIPLELAEVPGDELTFVVAHAIDRVRSGMALVGAVAPNGASDVAELLRGARAALTGAAPPESPLGQAAADALASAERIAALLGAAPRDQVLLDLEAAEECLSDWDAFQTAAARASDRFAALACQNPLAALRALYRQDHVLAPGAAAISERDRRIDFLRTAPLRALLEFLGSADYRHALGEPDAQTETDAGS